MDQGLWHVQVKLAGKLIYRHVVLNDTQIEFNGRFWSFD